jgi:hypothetical protein
VSFNECGGTVMDADPSIRRRELLKRGGAGAVGGLAVAGLRAPTASADGSLAGLVGAWFVEIQLDVPGQGTGNNEMAMWFLPGGVAIASSVWMVPDINGNPTLVPGASPGAWKVLDARRRKYTVRIVPLSYYPSAQNPFQESGSVARVELATSVLQLGADGLSFESVSENAIFYWYDRNGNLIAPPSPQDLGEVAKLHGRRITTDFGPPTEFPFAS